MNTHKETSGTMKRLALVAGDPLADLQALRRIRRGMLNGQWVAGADWPEPTDESRH